MSYDNIILGLIVAAVLLMVVVSVWMDKLSRRWFERLGSLSMAFAVLAIVLATVKLMVKVASS